MLDVHRLRLLREVSRRGSVTAAAHALAYTPSAVSQQLTQLQVETGVTLLERVGRGVRLTDEALLLVRHADAVLAQLELAEAELAAARAQVSGELRVATFGSVMLELVPAALTHVGGLLPDVRVTVAQEEPEPAVTGLLARDYDLVMGEEYPGLAAARVAGVDEEDVVLDPFHLAVPPHGPWSSARSVVDLAGAAWVLDPPALTSGQWELGLCRAAGFEPDVRFTTPDPLMHLHLVETGHAVAVVPDLLVRGRQHGARLVPLPGRPVRRLFSAVRRGAAGHPAVRAFRDGMRAGLPRG